MGVGGVSGGGSIWNVPPPPPSNQQLQKDMQAVLDQVQAFENDVVNGVSDSALQADWQTLQNLVTTAENDISAMPNVPSSLIFELGQLIPSDMEGMSTEMQNSPLSPITLLDALGQLNTDWTTIKGLTDGLYPT